MRTISRTTRFNKDYKRESKGQHRSTLDADLVPSSRFWLTTPPSQGDCTITPWPASGKTSDCHIRPDLVLIYRLPDAERVELVRLGSHSELSL